jgi:hypothetical protein
LPTSTRRRRSTASKRLIFQQGRVTCSPALAFLFSFDYIAFGP